MLSADGIAPWNPIVLGLARQTSGATSLLLPVRSVVNEKAAHRSAPAIERTAVATSDIVRLAERIGAASKAVIYQCAGRRKPSPIFG